tara:strand:- start:839 stop:1552 length:714 start_codon:yes stop_codon:yes gene_type:complete
MAAPRNHAAFMRAMSNSGQLPVNARSMITEAVKTQQSRSGDGRGDPRRLLIQRAITEAILGQILGRQSAAMSQLRERRKAALNNMANRLAAAIEGRERQELAIQQRMNEAERAQRTQLAMGVANALAQGYLLYKKTGKPTDETDAAIDEILMADAESATKRMPGMTDSGYGEQLRQRSLREREALLDEFLEGSEDAPARVPVPEPGPMSPAVGYDSALANFMPEMTSSQRGGGFGYG